MEYSFRIASFGGFNKQDVLDFLQLQAQEHTRQTQQLQQELDQVKKDYSLLQETRLQEGQMEAQCQQLQNNIKALQADLERVRGESRGVRAQLEQTQAQYQEQLSQVKAQLEQAQAQCRTLQSQADAFRADAEAYAMVKERTAGLELAAHRRAQMALNEAEEQARQIRLEANLWTSQMRQQYNDLRVQVDAAVTHAAEELQKAQAVLAQVSPLLQEQDEALAQVGQRHAGNAIPAPMPLPEE